LLFKAQINRLSDPFHQGIEGPGLGVAAPKLGNGGDIVPVLIAFDNYVESDFHGLTSGHLFDAAVFGVF
jgi:hypothetical protein